MIQTINLYNFQDAFQTIRPNSFSYDGLRALFDYLEQLEQDIGEPIELDVISISCDWTEWESLAEYQESYDYPTMEDIEDNTVVIYIDGTDSFITLAH
ncbi:hypothetical protein OAD61_00420 [bacterium]|nr:hypothetical protein [bacterium]